MSTPALWRGFTNYAKLFPFGSNYPIELIPASRKMVSTPRKRIWACVIATACHAIGIVLLPGHLILFRNFTKPTENYWVVTLVLCWAIMIGMFTVFFNITLILTAPTAVEGFNNIVWIEGVVKSGKIIKILNFPLQIIIKPIIFIYLQNTEQTQKLKKSMFSEKPWLSW